MLYDILHGKYMEYELNLYRRIKHPMLYKFLIHNYSSKLEKYFTNNTLASKIISWCIPSTVLYYSKDEFDGLVINVLKRVLLYNSINDDERLIENLLNSDLIHIVAHIIIHGTTILDNLLLFEVDIHDPQPYKLVIEHAKTARNLFITSYIYEQQVDQTLFRLDITLDHERYVLCLSQHNLVYFKTELKHVLSEYTRYTFIEL